MWPTEIPHWKQCARYCNNNPTLAECNCNGLFSYVMDENRDVAEIIGRFMSGAGGRYESFACECFLGAAAKHGFRYVKLKSYKPECNDQRQFNEKDYLTVCAKYKKQACKDDNGGTITKTSS